MMNPHLGKLTLHRRLIIAIRLKTTITMLMIAINLKVSSMQLELSSLLMTAAAVRDNPNWKNLRNKLKERLLGSLMSDSMLMRKI